ncbi:MAG: hypothetical protein ACOYB3_01875 [Azonexus sp.]
MRFIKITQGFDIGFVRADDIRSVVWAATEHDEWRVTFMDGESDLYRIEDEELEALRTTGR